MHHRLRRHQVGRPGDQAGASDFLRKPYDLDELILAVETAARAFSRDAHLNVYRRKDRELYNPHQIV